jgi:hypothetical protein
MATEPLVAERTFFLEGDPNETPVLTFRFWRPYQPEGDYPRCEYELVSDQFTQKGEVHGVDSVSSVIFCLAQAGSKVAGLNESIFGGRLRWVASPDGGRGLGLPTIEEDWPFHKGYKVAEERSRNQQNPGSDQP